MIRIGNLRKGAYKGNPSAPSIKVDRSNKILGNPFVLEDEAERDKVIEAYREWAEKEYANNFVFHNVIKGLRETVKLHGELNLMCWCAPKRCHAEVIKELIERFK